MLPGSMDIDEFEDPADPWIHAPLDPLMLESMDLQIHEDSDPCIVVPCIC